MNDYTYEKLFNENGEHIGRKCKCGKTILNPRILCPICNGLMQWNNDYKASICVDCNYYMLDT